MSYNLKIGFGYAGEALKIGFHVSTETTTLKAPGSGTNRSESIRNLLYIRFVF